ncbi:MAG: zinc-finger domain-containing protein [Thioalkalivibrionaceae bacterium]
MTATSSVSGHDPRPMANAEQRVEVTRADLPLFCPGPKSALWSSHPRVFIPLAEAENGQYRCPYCGTEYVLVD